MRATVVVVVVGFSNSLRSVIQWLACSRDRGSTGRLRLSVGKFGVAVSFPCLAMSFGRLADVSCRRGLITSAPRPGCSHGVGLNGQQLVPVLLNTAKGQA